METKNIKALREMIEEEIKDFDYDITDNDDVCAILDEVSVDEVASDGNITINFDGRCNVTGSDIGFGVHVSYWSHKIKKFVSLDSEMALDFPNVDDLVDSIVAYVDEAVKLEASINIEPAKVLIEVAGGVAFVVESNGAEVEIKDLD